jgi:hypothetical protein
MANGAFAVAFRSGDHADLINFDFEFFLRAKPASGAVLDGFQTRERISDLPGNRQRRGGTTKGVEVMLEELNRHYPFDTTSAGVYIFRRIAALELT